MFDIILRKTDYRRLNLPILNLDKNDDNPLFMGESLGLQEYTAPRYPILEELALLQRSQFWTETEIDMSKDSAQWGTLGAELQDISVLNLSWQIMADSIVGRVPFTVLLPFVTNPELEGLFIQWGYFENLHSRAYSNIIRTVFPEPQVVIDRIKGCDFSYKRLQVLREAFEELHSYTGRINKKTIPEIKKCIIKCMMCVYAMESVQFYASFACTFALAEQDILIGIADNLRLISKDEALHTRFAREILLIISKDPDWVDLYESLIPFFKGVMIDLIDTELNWGQYLFSEGRSVMGLTSSLLNDYSVHTAINSCNFVGLEVPELGQMDNPIPWIDLYIDPGKMQPAPQERNITNYRVGSTDGDLTGLGDLDF